MRELAIELASTIRHDGDGGVADVLAEPDGLAGWLRRTADLFGPEVDAAAVLADRAALPAVLETRRTIRSLLGHAVAPRPASRADAGRLLPRADAVRRLNADAARAPVAVRLDWPGDGAPVVSSAAAAAVPARDLLVATLARAAADLLTGPDGSRIRACPAPRCVRYFVQDTARQEWCKPSCGNRARVARHYRRHRDDG